MNNNIQHVIDEIQPLRNKLKNHSLYKSLKSIDDVKIFMESHVYAVWDFMSLLKALQNQLTCSKIPWSPNKDSKSARLINQIVVDEESDLNFEGFPKSHFEMYLEAMEEIQANTEPVKQFIGNIKNLDNIIEIIEDTKIDSAIKSFLKFTFHTIQNWKSHEIAAAFTFGREEIIPDMFIEIIEQTEKNYNISLNKINYYLQRHIELDGDEHGPLAHEMINALCLDDDKKWNEVIIISKKALEERIQLWDSIDKKIKKNHIHKKESYSSTLSNA